MRVSGLRWPNEKQKLATYPIKIAMWDLGIWQSKCPSNRKCVVEIFTLYKLRSTRESMGRAKKMKCFVFVWWTSRLFTFRLYETQEAKLMCWVAKRLPKHRKWCHTYSNKKHHTYINYDVNLLANVWLHNSGPNPSVPHLRSNPRGPIPHN